MRDISDRFTALKRHELQQFRPPAPQFCFGP